MVKVKCRYCNVEGSKFCTHGITSRKIYLTHAKNCKSPQERQRRRRENRNA